MHEKQAIDRRLNVFYSLKVIEFLTDSQKLRPRAMISNDGNMSDFFSTLINELKKHYIEELLGILQSMF